MKKELIIYGPFDRFNYGDLLFPYMIEYAFEKLYPGQYDFKKFSLKKVDLRKKGGVKSEDYRQMSSYINGKDKSVLIVAGGECLTAKWSGLYSFISPTYRKVRQSPFYIRVSQLPIVGRLMSKISLSRLILGGASEYPFAINKDDFKAELKVIYNAVGGGNDNSVVNSRLTRSNYTAVREKFSFEALETRNIQVALVPDCAIIMADFYPRHEFIKYSCVRESNKKFFESKKKYIYFQVAKYKHQNSIDEIVTQLEQLSIDMNLEVVLSPIGTALGHEDHIPLFEIFNRLNISQKHFIIEPNVLEIMGLIANSELYIGTSLHGVITAMSYGIPYIGLNKNQIKVQGYLETWGLDELNKIQDPKSFTTYAKQVLQIPKKNILNKAASEKRLYYKHVELMHEIIDAN